jgi:ribosomal protein L18
MGYRADEEEALRRRWAAALPSDCSAGWSRDLSVYRAHEHVKAALVESVRYTKLIAAGGLSAEARAAAITSLTRKMNAAHEVWATRTRLRNEDVEEAVTAVLGSPPPFLAAWTPVSC